MGGTCYAQTTVFWCRLMGTAELVQSPVVSLMVSMSASRDTEEKAGSLPIMEKARLQRILRNLAVDPHVTVKPSFSGYLAGIFHSSLSTLEHHILRNGYFFWNGVHSAQIVSRVGPTSI